MLSREMDRYLACLTLNLVPHNGLIRDLIGAQFYELVWISAVMFQLNPLHSLNFVVPIDRLDYLYHSCVLQSVKLHDITEVLCRSGVDLFHSLHDYSILLHT